MAFGTYWYVTLSVIVGAAATIFSLFRLINKYYVPPLWNKKACLLRSGIIIVLIFLILFGIKGKFSFHGRSLSSMTAQKLGNAKMTDIALNGVFSSFESLRRYKKRDLLFSEQEALAFVSMQTLTENESAPLSDYPLWQQSKTSSGKSKLNAVIIFLESWDMQYIQTQPDITPSFHKILQNGVLYERFYSAGKRSLLGVTASFFSIPYVWGLLYLNSGLEKYNFPRWAVSLQEAGWQTIFLQSDYHLSEKAANWTKYLGFEQFYGKEDIPVSHDYPSFHKGFDLEAADFFVQRLNNMQKPFVAVFYTSSTHSPYTAVLSKEHMPFTQPRNQCEEYYNRLNYADAALGAFFRQVEKEKWFKNTVFFILPDHRAIFHNNKLQEGQTPYDSFLVVYAPFIQSPPRRHNGGRTGRFASFRF